MSGNGNGDVKKAIAIINVRLDNIVEKIEELRENILSDIQKLDNRISRLEEESITKTSAIIYSILIGIISLLSGVIIGKLI